jgi:hypothetical protein
MKPNKLEFILLFCGQTAEVLWKSLEAETLGRRLTSIVPASLMMPKPRI